MSHKGFRFRAAIVACALLTVSSLGLAASTPVALPAPATDIAAATV